MKEEEQMKPCKPRAGSMVYYLVNGEINFATVVSRRKQKPAVKAKNRTKSCCASTRLEVGDSVSFDLSGFIHRGIIVSLGLEEHRCTVRYERLTKGGVTETCTNTFNLRKLKPL